MNNSVQFEEDFNSRTKKLLSGGGDGYLRPDQFLDHLTVIKNISLLSHLSRLSCLCRLSPLSPLSWVCDFCLRKWLA